MDTINIYNKRLSKYLYSLGFDRQSVVNQQKEYWIFRKSSNLQEALDFYFDMRKRNQK